MVVLTRTDAELASALRVALMRLVRRLRAERPELALSLTRLATLFTLDVEGPLTPAELARRERVQPPSMTRILASLEEQGLVSRTPHPSDGRQVLVAITPEAHELLQADRRARDEWLALRLGEISAQERATLRQAVEILDGLGRA